MKLYSTRFHDTSSSSRLNKEVLLEYAKRAKSITMFSAYYSSEFVSSFLGAIPKTTRRKCSVRMVFNGFSGNRLLKQKSDLEEIVANFSKQLSFKDLSVFLNFSSTLFHTKLYRFDDGNSVTWFVGSANASEAAFEDNEEILLKIDGPNSHLNAYVSKVIEKSEELNQVKDPEIDSLVKFWRTGNLYYKPNTQIQFTFNYLDMPDWVFKTLAGEPPRSTDTVEPWGAYNIKRALGVKDEVGRVRKRVGISTWSIETCLGHWVPGVYVEKVDSKIRDAGRLKKSKLGNIRNAINKCGKSEIIKDFQGYLYDINTILNDLYSTNYIKKGVRVVIDYGDGFYLGTVTMIKQGKVHIHFDDGDKDKINLEGQKSAYGRTASAYTPKKKSILGIGKKKRCKGQISGDDLAFWLVKEFWRPTSTLEDKFERFLSQLIGRMNNEKLLERASVPLVPASMPEIWTDPVSVEEFSDSFFEYIAYKIESAKQRPLIVKSIMEALEYNPKTIGSKEPDDVRRDLEKFIDDAGWSDSNWLIK